MNIKVDAERCEIRQCDDHWEVVNTWFGAELSKPWIVWTKESAFAVANREFKQLPRIVKRRADD